ncbi:MAG: putative sterol methyltransferase [Micavibrio sp.]|nr:putative sterol methyltransferase [Micavibrio sp.]
MTTDPAITAHYAQANLAEKILTALNATGKNMHRLVHDDLAAADEFHIGGRVATHHLMTYLQWHAEMHVLDVGSGLGGAARFVAENTRCRVTGLDLIPDYCAAAASLTVATGLQQYIIYKQGDATAMPFAAEEFDGAYSIHTAMNIADKATLYSEIAKVLKPGAFFGLFDVLRGRNEAAPSFPVPWANAPETSFLATLEDMRRYLGEAGFEILVEDDMGGFALKSLKKLQEANPIFGPRIVIGENYDEKIANLVRNIESKRCAPWVIICRKRKTWEDQQR